MRVLVTGATGFIGSHLVDALVQSGDEVIAFSRDTTKFRPGVRLVTGDVEDPRTTYIKANVDAIIHLAAKADASSSLGDPAGCNRTNAVGTLNMLELARRLGSVFIFASSQRIYRPQLLPLTEDSEKEPIDPYGYSKLIAEKWARMYRDLYGLPTVVLRFFSVYGPRQPLYGGTSGVVTIFLNRALKGEPLMVNDANLRDFTHVSDVVQGILLALKNPAALGKAYNIATGKATSVADLAQCVKEVVGSTSAIVIKGSDDRESYVADISKACAELGYAPNIELRQGLQLYVQYLREMCQDLA